MSELKKVGGYILVYEPLMKMYRVIHGDTMSLWFDSHAADDLLLLDDNSFIDECENNFEFS